MQNKPNISIDNCCGIKNKWRRCWLACDLSNLSRELWPSAPLAKVQGPRPRSSLLCFIHSHTILKTTTHWLNSCSLFKCQLNFCLNAIHLPLDIWYSLMMSNFSIWILIDVKKPKYWFLSLIENSWILFINIWLI